VPSDWATTQNNLGDALTLLAERENEATRFEQAVAAYGEALKEYQRERGPVRWALVTGKQGIAFCLLAQKSEDSAAAQRAVRQIKLALETIQTGGDATSAAYYAAELIKAQATFDRVKKR